jgi:hypothetical protein
MMSLPVGTPFEVSMGVSANSGAGYNGSNTGVGGDTSVKADIEGLSSYTLSLDPPGLAFNLPPGYTINSVSAGVVNNVAPPAVPLPASAWLLLSGLVGVGVMARKRRGIAA